MYIKISIGTVKSTGKNTDKLLSIFFGNRKTKKGTLVKKEDITRNIFSYTVEISISFFP